MGGWGLFERGRGGEKGRERIKIDNRVVIITKQNIIQQMLRTALFPL